MGGGGLHTAFSSNSISGPGSRNTAQSLKRQEKNRTPKDSNGTEIIEKCAQTELYVGYVPGILGAHSQGATPVGAL